LSDNSVVYFPNDSNPYKLSSTCCYKVSIDSWLDFSSSDKSLIYKPGRISSKLFSGSASWCSNICIAFPCYFETIISNVLSVNEIVLEFSKEAWIQDKIFLSTSIFNKSSFN
jgi:hypothetical protein